MKGYRPEELFDETGRLHPELAALAPSGARRMSANPHTNGGLLLRDLRLPDFRDYAVTIDRRGAVSTSATRPDSRACSSAVRSLAVTTTTGMARHSGRRLVC